MGAVFSIIFLFFATRFIKNHGPPNWPLGCWPSISVVFPCLNHCKHTGKLTFPAGRGHRCMGSAYTTLQTLRNIKPFLWKSQTVHGFLTVFVEVANSPSFSCFFSLL